MKWAGRKKSVGICEKRWMRRKGYCARFVVPLLWCFVGILIAPLIGWGNLQDQEGEGRGFPEAARSRGGWPAEGSHGDEVGWWGHARQERSPIGENDGKVSAGGFLCSGRSRICATDTMIWKRVATRKSRSFRPSLPTLWTCWWTTSTMFKRLWRRLSSILRQFRNFNKYDCIYSLRLLHRLRRRKWRRWASPPAIKQRIIPVSRFSIGSVLYKCIDFTLLLFAAMFAV